MGAQAIVVPCPPLKDTEPLNTPILRSNPLALATAMPVKFCIKR